MSITFAVDDVAPARERLAEREFELAALTASPPLGCSGERLTLVADGWPTTRRFGGPPDDRMHALVQAVDLAFNQHRPLRITPEAIWITLAQGFSIHVRHEAEALRPRFVRHEGTKTLRAEVESAPHGAAWRDLFARFGDAMCGELGPGLVALLTRPFSTTDADAQAVFHITLMETFKDYFEYESVLICGIPEVTLAGTVDDWRDLKRRVEMMGEYDLQWWTDALLPVCDQWISTAEGNADVAFWQAIHRPAAVYGGHVITGWLARLFPYVEVGDGWRRNDLRPARRIPLDAIKPANFQESQQRLVLRRLAVEKGVGDEVPWSHVGVSPQALPASWSRAEIRGAGLDAGRRYLAGGGLLGVAQSPGGTTLEPAVAWRVEEAPETAVWALLERDHEMTPVTSPGRRLSQGRPLRGALRSFFQRYVSASLFDGAVVIDGHTTRHPPRHPPRRRRQGLTVTPSLENEAILGPAYEHPRWSRYGLWTFARVGEHGALAHVSKRPHVVRGARLNGVLLKDELEVSEALPHRLDWIVYIPDVRREAVDDHIVIARDGWDFFHTLLSQPTPYFLHEGATLPGRFVDLLRNGPA